LLSDYPSFSFVCSPYSCYFFTTEIIIYYQEEENQEKRFEIPGIQRVEFYPDFVYNSDLKGIKEKQEKT